MFFLRYLVWGIFKVFDIELSIRHWVEQTLLKFALGSLYETPAVQLVYLPCLEVLSLIGAYWGTNCTLQLLYHYCVEKIPKPASVDYVPEFTPPNVVYTLSRHVWNFNPIAFAWRELRRLILWIRIAYHEHNAAYIAARIESVIRRHADARNELLKFGRKIPIFKNHQDHSHPLSASFRSAANEFMKDAAVSSGYMPYSVSKSNSYTVGNRFFYGIKDLGQVARNDPIPDNAALIFTDVDYYADMNAWLVLGRPIMMYTFAPTTLAGTTDEYSFRTVGDCVEYRVKGGAEYHHKIWDYKGDCMTVNDPRTGDLLTFSVEQRTVEGDPDHRIILLMPVATVPYPHCMYITGHAPLRRKKYGDGEYKHMFDPLTRTLSLAKDKDYVSVELSIVVYNAVQERSKAKSGPLLVSDIEKYLSQQGDPDATVKAPLLYNLMDTKFEPNVIKTSDIQVSYQPFNVKHPSEIVSEDGKPKGRAVSNQVFSQPALMPVKSISSDISSVLGRVEKPRNDIDPPSYLKNLKAEFVMNLVSQAGLVSSISTDEVAQKQNRAAQRSRFENAKHYFCMNVVGPLKTFIKAEGYAAPNDPRTITQVPGDITTLLSEYTYPFKEAILKKQQWYGPGKTPLETIERLRQLTTQSGVITTDFSRFDGSISEFLQSVAKACYMRAFSEKDRRRLGQLYRAIFTRTAYTECGLKYDAGVGTRSGSPITTDANTIINAYVMYCALRKLGLTDRQAMAEIGLACGDDGYMRNRPGLKDALKAVCRDLGLDLKPEEHIEGPYPYLGRYFCDPATTTTSFQDPMRTLAKIHLTANSNISMAQARVNKALGYLTTDRITPMIGDYCRLSVQKTEGDDPDTVYSGRSFTHEEEHKMTLAWPQDPNDKDLIDQQVGKLCKLEASELEQRVKLINDCSSYKEVPILFDNERDTKIIAEVNGLIEYPAGTHISNRSNEPKPTGANQSDRQASQPSRTGDMQASERPRPKTGEPKQSSRPKRARDRGGRPAQSDRVHKSPNRGTPGRNPPTAGTRSAQHDREFVSRSAPASTDQARGKPARRDHGSDPEAPLMAVNKHGLGNSSACH